MNSPVPHDTAEMPYTEGNILELTIAGSQGDKIRLKVLKVYSPFTLSCVMQVEVEDWVTESASNSSRAVLKMYDRRFAEQLRQDEKVGTWSPEREMAYRELVKSGEVLDLIHKLNEDVDEDSNEPDEDLNDAQNEALIYDLCSKLYKAEVHAYSRLQQLQGKEIPKLHQEVILPPPQTHDNAIKPDDEEFLQIKGILLECIDGVTLSDIPTISQISRTSWQTIIDQAIRIVHRVSDHGIRNEDVRAANIVVTSTAEQDESQHRVVMLDFANCKFREPEESDKEWGRAKWSQDEEGAVGLVMRNRMRKVGFELAYEPSLRYLEFAPGEDSP